MDIVVFISLYMAFVVKHWLSDYVLQTRWMITGKDRPLPLLAHAGIHAAGTLMIVLVAAPALWWLAFVDLVLHAAIDRAKHWLSRGLGPTDPVFWWAFGGDQALHQLTHLAFVLMIVLRG
ncbi:MAG: DUF3307 domain-containing protein [Pararhodobacter sp.]